MTGVCRSARRTRSHGSARQFVPQRESDGDCASLLPAKLSADALRAVRLDVADAEVLPYDYL